MPFWQELPTASFAGHALQASLQASLQLASHWPSGLHERMIQTTGDVTSVHAS